MNLTWDDILALDTHPLFLAVEEQCWGRAWSWAPKWWPGSPWGWWCNGEFQGYAPELPYAAVDTWERCMGLAWRYGLTVHPPAAVGEGGRVAVWQPGQGIEQNKCLDEDIVTEADARLALCRLALWAALQRKGTL